MLSTEQRRERRDRGEHVRLAAFEAQFAPTGLATCRYKGQHLLDKPMSTDEYYDAFDAWLDGLAAQGE